jgi:hypothetical protein
VATATAETEESVESETETENETDALLRVIADAEASARLDDDAEAIPTTPKPPSSPSCERNSRGCARCGRPSSTTWRLPARRGRGTRGATRRLTGTRAPGPTRCGRLRVPRPPARVSVRTRRTSRKAPIRRGRKR